ncbi:hypothetical protein CC99x_005910 [Candidatus Berkiella cookevillensis]|uniref:Uncharacterized protein n=1 Tax=Candidatus Berkiella cookevillensis TaxID=437022 RepID=A0A0Q9YHE5_9GAMM|nr:hypothetical protein [Candidatus Berkiella cookevillensis]MCS5708439.1 hypothetical protein [Candidatus Berkiella cookevillensis]
MYHYALGAGLGGFLVAYKIYQSCCKKTKPTEETPYQFESLTSVLTQTDEENFDVFANHLGRLLDLFALWPYKLDQEGIWSQNSTPPEVDMYQRILSEPPESATFQAILKADFQNKYNPITMICVLKSDLQADLNSTFSRYSDTKNLRENLLARGDDNAAVTNVITQHLHQLVCKGYVKEAYVLHNFFHLLHKIDQHSVKNLTPANTLAVLLMPWVCKWLKISSPTSKIELAEQRNAMKNIIPKLITAPLFKECFDLSAYGNYRPRRRKKPS